MDNVKVNKFVGLDSSLPTDRVVEDKSTKNQVRKYQSKTHRSVKSARQLDDKTYIEDQHSPPHKNTPLFKDSNHHEESKELPSTQIFQRRHI